MKTDPSLVTLRKKQAFFPRLWKNICTHPLLYLMAIPVLAFFAIFCYWPMYGVLMAFVDFNPVKGLSGSKWVGFDNFVTFFADRAFTRAFRNTITINLEMLAFAFTFPIIFALLLNELRSSAFRRITQTVTYMPHFISNVVICGLVINFLQSTGLITSTLHAIFGVPLDNLLSKPYLFQPVYVLTSIWQQFGWDSIIYFAALSGISPELYEAATVDGASRFQRVLHVTIPGILPTIIILLILRIGNLMSLGWERIYLLQNPLIMDTSDVISTLVYRRGLLQTDYSFGVAVGLFNSVINIILLISANMLSRRVNETSLW